MVPIVVFSMFVIAALFGAGSMIRPVLLPAIIIATLVYLVYWSDLFKKDDTGRFRRQSAEHAATQ